MAEPGPKLDPTVVEVTCAYRKLMRFSLAECRRANCVGADGVITGIGKSPEDLASDTIMTLHARGWRPGTEGEDVVPLGRVIIRNKVTDIVRSRAYRASIALDIEELEKRGEAQNEVTPHAEIEPRLVIETFKRTLDKIGKKYLEAGLAGAETPEDYAKALNTTPEEAEKIRRRLKYRAQLMREML